MDSDMQLLVAILVFGTLALGAAAWVQILKGKTLSANFVKLFGLLFIGTLATGIVFVEISAEARTGAYTILGTIAGYLAGSRGVSTGGGGTGGGTGGPGAPRAPMESSL